jgi:hypothetical protein
MRMGTHGRAQRGIVAAVAALTAAGCGSGSGSSRPATDGVTHQPARTNAAKKVGQLITAIPDGAHVISDGVTLLAVPGDTAGGAEPVSYRLSDGKQLATLTGVPTKRCSIFLLPRSGRSGLVITHYWLQPGDPNGAPDAYIERVRANDVQSGATLWTTDVNTVSSTADDPTVGCYGLAWITSDGGEVVMHLPELVLDSATGRILQRPADAVGTVGRYLEVGSPPKGLAYDHVDFADPVTGRVAGSIDGITFGQDVLFTVGLGQAQLALPFDNQLGRSNDDNLQAVTNDGTVLNDEQGTATGGQPTQQLVGYAVPSGRVLFTARSPLMGNSLDYDETTNLAVTYAGTGMAVVDAVTGRVLWSGPDQDRSGLDGSGNGSGYCGATDGHVFRVTGGQLVVLDERTGKTVTTLPRFGQCPQVVRGGYVSGSDMYAG